MNNNIMRNNQNTNEQMNKLQNELNSFQRNINDQIYNLKKNPNVNISSTLKKSSIIGNSRYTNEGNDLQTRFQNVKAPQININQNQDPNFKNSYNQNNENNKQIKIEKNNKYKEEKNDLIEEEEEKKTNKNKEEILEEYYLKNTNNENLSKNCIKLKNTLFIMYFKYECKINNKWNCTRNGNTYA